MPNLADIASFLNIMLDTERYPADERPGIFMSTARPIRRLGLALDPWPTLASWLEHEDLDAIFLHRPFKLNREIIPATRGVVYAYLPFDERLTVGYVPRLADLLGLRARAPMGDKSGRPLGMVGELPKPMSLVEWRRVINDIYGGLDESWDDGPTEIRKIAVVNSISPGLVQEASLRKVDAYLTRQLQAPARAACKAHKISAHGVGQRRAELWGLRTLSGMLRERWATIRVPIFEDRPQ